MSYTPPNITIERHGYRLPDSPQRLEDYTTSLSVGEGVDNPWGGIQLTLKLPPNARREELRPQSGDWIVVRDTSRDGAKALGFGYVLRVDDGFQIGDKGQVMADQTRVTAISWLAHLFGVQLINAAGIGNQFAGTLMQYKQWSKVLLALLNASRDSIGYSLEEVWQEVARVRLPPSLGGGEFRQMIPVVHSELLANQFAEPRAGVHVEVPGPRVDGFQSGISYQTTIGDLLWGSYVPDTNLIELFPSLEVQPTAGLADDIAEFFPSEADPELPESQPIEPHLDPDFNPLESQIAQDVFGGVRGFGPTDAPASFVESNALALARRQQAAALLRRTLGGVQPVLMYRMRPWAAKSPDEFARYIDPLLFRTNVELENVVRAESGTVITNMFNVPPFSDRNAVDVDVDAILGFHTTTSDDNRVNAVVVGLPGQPDSPIRFWSRAGLPLLDRDDIRDHGLRLFNPSWPFLVPHEDTTADLTDVSSAVRSVTTDISLIGQLRTVGIQAALIMGRSETYGSGSVRLRYSPDIKAGFILRLHMPRNQYDGRYYCYAQEVTHNFTVDNRGAVHAETVVQFNRGQGPDILFPNLDFEHTDPDIVATAERLRSLA